MRPTCINSRVGNSKLNNHNKDFKERKQSSMREVAEEGEEKLYPSNNRSQIASRIKQISKRLQSFQYGCNK